MKLWFWVHPLHGVFMHWADDAKDHDTTLRDALDRAQGAPMPTDPKLSASDEALLANLDALRREHGSDREGACLCGYQDAESCPTWLALDESHTRLREVLAERGETRAKAVRLVKMHAQIIDQQTAEIARLRADADAAKHWREHEGELRRGKLTAERERDALKAQLAEARERTLEEAAAVCDEQANLNVTYDDRYGEGRFDGGEQCAAAIRKLK